jgi:hypothetical protein
MESKPQDSTELIGKLDLEGLIKSQDNDLHRKEYLKSKISQYEKEISLLKTEMDAIDSIKSNREAFGVYMRSFKEVRPGSLSIFKNIKPPYSAFRRT